MEELERESANLAFLISLNQAKAYEASRMAHLTAGTPGKMPMENLQKEEGGFLSQHKLPPSLHPITTPKVPQRYLGTST